MSTFKSSLFMKSISHICFLDIFGANFVISLDIFGANFVTSFDIFGSKFGTSFVFSQPFSSEVLKKNYNFVYLIFSLDYWLVKVISTFFKILFSYLRINGFIILECLYLISNQTSVKTFIVQMR